MKLQEMIVPARQKNSMPTSVRVGLFFAMSLTLFVSAPPAMPSTANVYISQNGSGSGISCSDTLSAAWFNNSANWGSASNQIGPGTTVHLCGNFTGAAGSNELVFQGSGSSGAPITLLFESGASLQAPYWGNAWTNLGVGAIVVSGESYITINGGTNGYIQNTANGTGLTYTAQNSTLVGIYSSTNVTVENLLLEDMCVRSAGDAGANCDMSVNASGVVVVDSSNVTVTNNTVHDGDTCLVYGAGSGDSNVLFEYNTLSRCNWEVGASGAESIGTHSNFQIVGNDMSCVSGGVCNWDDADDYFHHNGIHIYTQPNETFNGTVIANNYIHDIGDSTNPGHETGHIFLEQCCNSGNIPGVLIYNNVLVQTLAAGDGPANGFITVGFGITGAYVYNNTVYGPTACTSACIGVNASESATIENNVIDGSGQYVNFNGTYSGTISNYNDFYGVTGSSGAFQAGSNTYSSLSAWYSATGFDANSLTTNPNLAASYAPQSPLQPSSGNNNLTSSGISGLDQGAPQYFGVNYACGVGCVPRPTSGFWYVGVYPALSSVSNQPAAPTSLVATVH